MPSPRAKRRDHGSQLAPTDPTARPGVWDPILAPVHVPLPPGTARGLSLCRGQASGTGGSPHPRVHPHPRASSAPLGSSCIPQPSSSCPPHCVPPVNPNLHGCLGLPLHPQPLPAPWASPNPPSPLAPLANPALGGAPPPPAAPSPCWTLAPHGGGGRGGGTGTVQPQAPAGDGARPGCGQGPAGTDPRTSPCSRPGRGSFTNVSPAVGLN